MVETLFFFVGQLSFLKSGDTFEECLFPKHLKSATFEERQKCNFFLLKQSSIWSKETPPPGGGSYLLCSLIKNRV